jgi:tRNA-splicing ligase RtcB
MMETPRSPRCARPVRCRPSRSIAEAVNCHHNYVAKERHFGADVLVTRKGAVRAGARRARHHPRLDGRASYIVRGKGNPESFCSCSHGAGRAMSRAEAKRRFTSRTTPRRPRASSAARTPT